MIFITGDLHGHVDKSKLNTQSFPQQKELTKDDFVIIAGDFGGIWDESRSENWLLRWLEKKRFTTLFVDGNHENFDLLNSYPVTAWKGGNVHEVRPGILHLMRGQVFQIEGMKFFTFGGADSIDKHYRKEGVSWWPQERPAEEEFDEGMNNLAKHNYSVDYVISHTAPLNIAEQLTACSTRLDPVTIMLSVFQEKISFKRWYFGHFHKDTTLGNYTALYQEVVPAAGTIA